MSSSLPYWLCFSLYKMVLQNFPSMDSFHQRVRAELLKTPRPFRPPFVRHLTHLAEQRMPSYHVYVRGSVTSAWDIQAQWQAFLRRLSLNTVQVVVERPPPVAPARLSWIVLHPGDRSRPTPLHVTLDDVVDPARLFGRSSRLPSTEAVRPAAIRRGGAALMSNVEAVLDRSPWGAQQRLHPVRLLVAPGQWQGRSSDAADEAVRGQQEGQFL